MIRSILLFAVLSTSAHVQALATKQKPVVVNAKKAKRTDYVTDSKYKVDYKFSSWGILPSFKDVAINVVDAWKTFEKKKEVVVAVVDTGIDYGHPFLKKNLYLPGDKKINAKNFGMDFSKGTKNKFGPRDTHGHGTHISGIIRSIYPDVKILSLKYYNPRVKNKDNLDATVKALEYAIDQNVDIINYSSGGAGASIEELRVLKKAEKKGILVVAAAGNEASNIDVKENFYFPASYRLKNMITVINHDKKGKVNVSSNWGAKSADLSAPGSKIKSAFPKATSGYLTGTSQSTAFVSGVAALLMSQYPDLKVNQIKEAILKGARKLKTLTKKCRTGAMLDARGAQQIAAKLSRTSTRKIAQKK
jgi:subtilisin family serine protease